MKKLLSLAILASGTLFIVSCGDDDGGSTGPTDAELQEALFDASAAAVGTKVSTDASATGLSSSAITTAFEGWTAALPGSGEGARVAQDTVEVSGLIEANETWSSSNVYKLMDRVTVVDGVTLTINAGTVIAGDDSKSGVDAAVLMIARGGKIMAEGTATDPIIMTTSKAAVKSLTADDKGLWGGLVVLGKAPVSGKVDDPQIEGVPSEDTNGLYGGDAASDDSGVIKYVSIRHGGAIIDAAAGDEINGLTLGGVGSGTTIEYVEVYANSDDGIEFFGGTVDVENALVYAVGDDAIDVDQSYAGTVTNYAIYVDANSDEGLEIDGREGTYDDTFTLTNGTIEAIGGASITCDFKSKAKGAVTNLNANGGTIKLSASFDEESLTETEDASLNVQNDELTFTTVNAVFAIYTDDLTLLEQ